MTWGARILTGLGIVASAAVLLLALAWFFQRSLIYFPLTQIVPPAADVLARSQEVAFATEDGLRLGGWFVPAEGNGSGMTVLIFNGNAGNRSFRAPLAAALSRAGLAVFLFDYRGYGGNPGSPSETGLIADARAARAYLASRTDLDPARIIYVGESLGAAVAVALAVESPPVALVLRSPFTSLVNVGLLHYPFLPVRLFLVDRYPSIDRIGLLTCPVLIVAGERDRIIPAEHSRRLYEAASGQKRFVLIPGADHNDFDLLAGEQFISEVLRFLKDTAGFRSRADA